MEKKKIFILVEGNTDLRIITAFIAKNYGFENPKSLSGQVTLENEKLTINLKTLSGKGLSGCSAMEHDEIHEDIREFTAKGYNCLAILDADSIQKNAKNGGCIQRVNWLKEIIDHNSLILHFFLLPNNQDDGDLEILLRRSLSIEQQGIIACIEQFNNCLENYKEYPDFEKQQNKDLLHNTCKKVFKNFEFDHYSDAFENLRQFFKHYL
jgi:hypothetical protein